MLLELLNVDIESLSPLGGGAAIAGVIAWIGKRWLQQNDKMIALVEIATNAMADAVGEIRSVKDETVASRKAFENGLSSLERATAALNEATRVIHSD